MNKLNFLNLFNNKHLRNVIFKKVNEVHLRLKVGQTYKWNDLTKSIKLLVSYGYLDLFKQYCTITNNKDIIIKKLNDNYSFKTLIEYIVRWKRLNFLQYIIEELQYNYKVKYRNWSNLNINHKKRRDLLFYVSYEGSFEIARYLASLLPSSGNNENENQYNIKEWEFIKAIDVSPFSNSLDMVKFICLKAIDSINNNENRFNILKKHLEICINNAINKDRLDMVEWLIDISKSKLSLNLQSGIIGGIEIAVINGNLAILELCLENTSIETFDQFDCIDVAAKYNQFEVIKWLYHRGINRSTYRAMSSAAKNGRLDILKWLHEHLKEGCTTQAMNYAASVSDDNGLVVLKWLHDNRTEGCSVDAFRNAVKHGNLETIKWLFENYSIKNQTSLMYDAAGSGNLEMIKWLNDNRTSERSFRFPAIDNAAKYGHLEVVKWLYENGWNRCTLEAARSAAENGHLEVIMWLHEFCSGFFTKEVMSMAIKNGHWDVIQWLHDNRTESTSNYAYQMALYAGKVGDTLDVNRTLNLMKWLNSNRKVECLSETFDLAVIFGVLEVVIWLHENRTEGCTLDAIGQATWSGYLDIVVWFHENRPEVFTVKAMDSAILNNQLDTVKWLHENRTEGYSGNKTVEMAIQNNDWEMINWLYDNRTECDWSLLIDRITKIHTPKSIKFLNKYFESLN